MPQDEPRAPLPEDLREIIQPDTEDEIAPAPLEELERSFGEFLRGIRPPDTLGEDLNGEGGGSWRDEDAPEKGRDVYVEARGDGKITRKTRQLPQTCEETFRVLSIVRWNAACTPDEMQTRFREAVLRAFRQAAEVCQHHVAAGRMCEKPVFRRLAMTGWACPDSRGQSSLGVSIEFECLGL